MALIYGETGKDEHHKLKEDKEAVVVGRQPLSYGSRTTVLVEGLINGGRRERCIVPMRL